MDQCLHGVSWLQRGRSLCVTRYTQYKYNSRARTPISWLWDERRRSNPARRTNTLPDQNSHPRDRYLYFINISWTPTSTARLKPICRMLHPVRVESNRSKSSFTTPRQAMLYQLCAECLWSGLFLLLVRKLLLYQYALDYKLNCMGKRLRWASLWVVNSVQPT